MDVSEVIQEAYRDYETLSRDPDVLPTDVRAAYSTAEQVGPFAATLDMRFVNVLNQVRLRACAHRLRMINTSLFACSPLATSSSSKWLPGRRKRRNSSSLSSSPSSD